MTRLKLGAAALPLALLWPVAAAAAVPADLKTKADAVVTGSYPADGPGAAVVVMDDGRIVYAAGRGLSNVEAKRPITPDTVFRLGSITKQFTAAVILQLAEEGKLSLSDPLSKFLADYPKPGANATVAQLLNHSSGIQSYTGISGWMASDKPAVPVTTKSLIAEFRDKPDDFAAGTRFSYNNSGYVLLGAIIEAVTNKPWHAAIEDRITKPLGLTSIRYGVEEPKVKNMAAGYTERDGKAAPARPIHMSVPHAAGALVGTVGDLAKWAKALHGGQVVKSETYQQMIARTRLSDSKEVDYAFGLSNGDVRGRRSIGHGGGIFGFSTSSLYVPGGDVFVAVFANSDKPMSSPDMTAVRLAAIAIDDPYPSFTRAEIPSAELEPLAGVYKLAEGEQRLFMRDGKLFTRRTGGSDLEAIPAGQGRFFYPKSLTWFTATKDEAGKPLLSFYQNGSKTPEIARWSGPIPPEAASVDLPRATLARYAGRYQFGPAPLLVTLGDDGYLTVKLGPRNPVPIIPTSSNEFRAESVDARVIFHEGRSGVAPHHRSGRTPARCAASRCQLNAKARVCSSTSESPCLPAAASDAAARLVAPVTWISSSALRGRTSASPYSFSGLPALIAHVRSGSSKHPGAEVMLAAGDRLAYVTEEPPIKVDMWFHGR
ncbi:MAG: beta-lactamase family protein [Pseudomonadota bacterium]|nr:beta-lactamase family protein [Pseudomonadota bacterium]